jgi:tetratricopeptide (TPR) repeat protein
MASIFRYLERWPDVIDTSDKVLSYAGSLGTPVIRSQRIEALFFKMYALSCLDRFEDVLKVCDELLDWLGQERDPAFRGRLFEVVVEKGRTLAGWLGRLNDAIAFYESAIARFSNEEFIADIWWTKGTEFLVNQRYAEAIEAFNQMLNRYGRDTRSAPTGLVNQANALGALGRYDEAIANLDYVIEHYPLRRQVVVGAISAKGSILTKLGRADQAIAVYEQMLGFGAEHAKRAAEAKKSLAILMREAQTKGTPKRRLATEKAPRT